MDNNRGSKKTCGGGGSNNQAKNQLNRNRRSSLPAHLLLPSLLGQNAPAPPSGLRVNNRKLAEVESEDSFWGSDLEEELELDEEEYAERGFESFSETEDELAVLEEEDEDAEADRGSGSGSTGSGSSGSGGGKPDASMAKRKSNSLDR